MPKELQVAFLVTAVVLAALWPLGLVVLGLLGAWLAVQMTPRDCCPCGAQYESTFTGYYYEDLECPRCGRTRRVYHRKEGR